MSVVFIQNLVADGIVGVYEHERDSVQRLEFDIELQCDTAAAEHSDNLSDALDYADVSAKVIEYVKASQFQLLEALGAALLELILQNFTVTHVKLTIRKPAAVADADCVGVILERSA